MTTASRSTWKTIHVFISSTFKDMREERDYLARFVFPALREELLTRRVHLVETDLRWGLSSGQDATAACKEIIDRCRPWFIGILGNRYGTVPPGQDSSITDEEIRHGVLTREERGHAFIYLRRIESGEKMDPDDRRLYFDDPGSLGEKGLERLFADIAAAGLHCRTYSAWWDGARRRLVQLQMLGAHVREDLTSSILREVGMESMGPVDVYAEERGAMEDFLLERTRQYVEGHHAPVLRRLHDFARANGEPNILVVEGPSGAGKSSLLSRFYQQCTESAGSSEGSLESGSPLVIAHFVGASTRSSEVRLTLARLCHELRAVLPEEEDTASLSSPEKAQGEELVNLYAQLLHKAARSRRVILVLDAVDQFGPARRARTLDLLPRNLPPEVRIIVSARTPGDFPRGAPQDLDSVTGLLRFRGIGFTRVGLESLPQDEATQLIHQVLGLYHKELQPECVATLLRKPGSGSPLYLRVALEELRTLARHEDILQRVGALPDEVRPLFRWILEERLSSEPMLEEGATEPGRAARLVRDFVSFLGVSRQGLSHRHLVALVDQGDPRGDIAALERLLRPYLMRRGVLLDFHHAQLREAVIEGFLASGDAEDFYHQRLAKHLLKEVESILKLAEAEGQGQALREEDTHALRELAYHLTRARDWDALRAKLSNKDFLGALLKQFGEEAVFEDYLLAYDALAGARPALAEQLVQDLALMLAAHEEVESPWLQLASWYAFLVYRAGQVPALYRKLLEAGASRADLPGAFVAHCQLRLGSLLRREGKLAQAEELLRNALAGLPEDNHKLRALAGYELGYLLFVRGEHPTEAAEHLRKSAEHSLAIKDFVSEHISRCAEARVRFIFDLISAQECLGVLDGGKKLFDQAAAEVPPHPSAERWRVNVVSHAFDATFAAGLTDRARQYLEQLSDLGWGVGPGRAHYLSLLRARFAMLERNWARALEHFGELPSPLSGWAANPEGMAQVYLDKGMALAAAGQWDAARSVWQEGLECPDEQGNRPWKARIRQELARES